MGQRWEGNRGGKWVETPAYGLCTMDSRLRDIHCFEADLWASIRVGDQTSLLIPLTPRVPLWRCNVFSSQVSRKLWLTLAGAALLTVVGCSNQATDVATSTAAKAQPAKPAAAKPAAVVSKAPAAPAMITVPKGTVISATVGQTLATDKNKVGDTFAGTLTSPIQVEGKTVIPKGAKVTGRIVKVKKHELKVALASVTVHGKSYQLETNSVAGSNPAKDADKAKANKDVTVLAVHSKVTFKLAKPVAIAVKG